MHDPDFVLFDIRRPWPQVRRLQKPHPRPGLGFPFARVGRTEFYFPAVATVWHREPCGADSGTVCKDGPGSGLPWAALRWGWTHRRHLTLKVMVVGRWKRWRTNTCPRCGKRLGFNEVGGSYMNHPRTWHMSCLSLDGVTRERDEAREALVAASVCEAELIAGGMDQTKAWRVMYGCRPKQVVAEAEAITRDEQP